MLRVDRLSKDQLKIQTFHLCRYDLTSLLSSSTQFEAEVCVVTLKARNVVHTLCYAVGLCVSALPVLTEILHMWVFAVLHPEYCCLQTVAAEVLHSLSKITSFYKNSIVL